MDIEIRLRAATEADVQAIREIYNYEILTGTATFDTEAKTLEDRLAWFRETQRHPHVVLAAEVEGETVGWGCLQAFRPRPAYRFTAEDSVYVHQDWRDKRIGTAILSRLVDLAREKGFRSVVAVIAEGHPDSEALHARFGFEHVGRLHKVGYKFERWLDVVHMQLTL
ncbi:MAG: N-acetyltransferase family protein [Chloroflexota bacterium]|nr:N-acetyltransferase family protein [Chloroflexota bacterium]